MSPDGSYTFPVHDHISFVLLYSFLVALSGSNSSSKSCRGALRQIIKERLTHNTIDLGIAPETVESYQIGEIEIEKNVPLDRLKAIRGHLVCFPMDFMCKEDLRPVFNESEYYASPQVFH